MFIDHNPHFFPEPEKFIPSRWYDVPEHDISMFSFGPRACIGRKFAQTEALCFLASVLRDWKLDVVLKNGETREECEKRMMEADRKIAFAFGVGPVKLKVVKRV